MKFKYVNKAALKPVTIYGGQLAKFGDVVDSSKWRGDRPTLEAKARRNPHYELVDDTAPAAEVVEDVVVEDELTADE